MNDHAYPWQGVLALQPEEAIRNAETYTFFAFLMRCADKGYRLKKDGDVYNLKDVSVNEGLLVYDEHLEKADGWNSIPS